MRVGPSSGVEVWVTLTKHMYYITVYVHWSISITTLVYIYMHLVNSGVGRSGLCDTAHMYCIMTCINRVSSLKTIVYIRVSYANIYIECV